MAIFAQEDFLEAGGTPVQLNTTTADAGGAWQANNGIDVAANSAGYAVPDPGGAVQVARVTDAPGTLNCEITAVVQIADINSGAPAAARAGVVLHRDGSDYSVMAGGLHFLLYGDGNWVLNGADGNEIDGSQGINPVSYTLGNQATIVMAFDANSSELSVTVGGNAVPGSPWTLAGAEIPGAPAPPGIVLYGLSADIEARVLSISVDDLSGANQSPVVDTPIPNQTDTEGDSVNLDISGNFSDPDIGDTLTYSVTTGALPAGLTLDGNTGVISGTIQSGASGSSPYTIGITANDGNGGTVEDQFTWTVTEYVPTVSFSVAGANVLENVFGNPVASETQIQWAVLDGLNPGTASIAAQNTNGSTDANGEMTLSLNGSALASGSPVLVIARTSDGSLIGAFPTTVD